MNRRTFLTHAALAPLAFGADAKPILLTIHPDQPSQPIAPEFMGLGYEIASVARPGLLTARNKIYTQLVRTLSARGVIRIGGNTADFASYSPTGAPVSRPFGTVVNDAVMRDLGTFLKATNWRLIWAVNLGRGTEADAIAQVKAVTELAGDRLLGIEVGNEPDLFGRAGHRKPDYGYDTWLADYRRYKGALRAEFPHVPFAGPDAAGSTDWVTRFASDEGQDASVLTQHYYREGQNPTSTIEKLLGPDPKLQPRLEELSAASKSSGRPYRICEVNSFSGGGRPGVSDTFASALWVLDYMYTLATYGCSGVNMQTGVNHRDFVSSYSPIGDDEHGHYKAMPEYYGMLAFSIAGKGELLKTELTGNPPEIKAYATRPRKGTTAVTLINKGSSPVAIGFEVQGRNASVIRMRTATVEAKDGVTLGGAEVTAAGAWKASKTEMLSPLNGHFRIELPGASAAIAEIA